MKIMNQGINTKYSMEMELPQKLNNKMLEDTLADSYNITIRGFQNRKRKVAKKAVNVEFSTIHNQNSIKQVLAKHRKSEGISEELEGESKELSFEPSVDAKLGTSQAQPEILIKYEVPEDDSLVENFLDNIKTGLGNGNKKEEDHPLSVEYQDGSEKEWTNVDVTTEVIENANTEPVELEFEINEDLEISEFDNEIITIKDKNEKELFGSGLKPEYEIEAKENIDEVELSENKLISYKHEINEMKEGYDEYIKEEIVDIYYENIMIEIKNEPTENAEEFEDELVDQDSVEREGAENLKYEEVEVFKHELIDEALKDEVREGCNTVELENGEPILITIEQIPILQQQMTQHVQMLTQNFILTYKHPELHQSSCLMKEYLLNIKFLCEGKDKSMFHTINLSTSLELVDYWEKLLATNNDDVKKMNLHIEETIAKSIRSYQSGGGYIVTFPSLILETISSSTAFVYSSLLPKIPFKSPKIAVKQCVYYTNSEDHIISLGLEQFMPLVSEEKHSEKTWSRKKGTAVCQYIHEHMLTYREATKIFSHINFVRHKRPPSNPIKYYFEFGKAPPYVHCVIPMGELILPPNKRSLEELPYQWREFVKSRQVNATSS